MLKACWTMFAETRQSTRKAPPISVPPQTESSGFAEKSARRNASSTSSSFDVLSLFLLKPPKNIVQQGHFFLHPRKGKVPNPWKFVIVSAYQTMSVCRIIYLETNPFGNSFELCTSRYKSLGTIMRCNKRICKIFILCPMVYTILSSRLNPDQQLKTVKF